MNRYLVFLRGVMPTGRTKVPMAEARAILSAAGYGKVRSYIATGNFLLDTAQTEAAVAQAVQTLIAEQLGPKLEVLVRSPEALSKVLADNPFPDGKPNQVLVTFLPKSVQEGFLDGVSTQGREQVMVAEREVYIHYPDGIGRSTLKLPKVVQSGTARNLNTLRKLLDMATQD